MLPWTACIYWTRLFCMNCRKPSGEASFPLPDCYRNGSSLSGALSDSISQRNSEIPDDSAITNFPVCRTHTRAAGLSKDVDPGGLLGLLGFSDPYGWKNCVKLKSSENAGKSNLDTRPIGCEGVKANEECLIRFTSLYGHRGKSDIESWLHRREEREIGKDLINSPLDPKSLI